MDCGGNIEEALAKLLFEARTFDKLHNHDQASFDGHRRMEWGDVRVLQAGVDFDFTQKAVCEGRVCLHVGKRDLHGLFAVCNQVAYPVDSAHAAAAQNPGYLVIAEYIPDLN